MASLLPIRATTSSPPSTAAPPTEILEQQFGRKGIKFADHGGLPTVHLSVRNGSSLSLSLPGGLVTSYKPKVYWRDDGFEEVLHTVAAPPPAGGGPPFRGGLSLVLNDVSKKGGNPWSPSQWDVKDVDSDSIDAVQVELKCTDDSAALEINYVISLYPLSMAAAVTVKNTSSAPVTLTSAILTHMKSKSRRGSAVRGLTGCSYSVHSPPPSSFGLISAADYADPDGGGGGAGLLGAIFGGGRGDEREGRGSWKVEENMYTLLKEKVSRVYAAPPSERSKRIYNTPPSKFETIDQGSGLGFRVIRMGYDDFYLASPGSSSLKPGNDYFICAGPASMLVPVVVNPGEVWRGAQVIEHDNL